jgi:3',5'-cyclic AMP phosphodiesterase CpdA
VPAAFFQDDMMLICQLTDLHIRPAGVPAYRVVETNMLTERALRTVAALDPLPSAVVITGDLTDFGAPEEYRVLAGLLRKHLDMPIYVIPGNHDNRDNFRAGLGHLPGVTEDENFVQYVVDDLPVRLVMLDTHVPGESYGRLCTKRLEFLDNALAAAPDKPTIVAMHHPPFLCGIGHMDMINLRNADEFAAVIARHRQVERVICGHHHRPIVTRVAHAITSIAPSVAHQVELDLRPGVPGAFVMEPAAYELFLWTKVSGIVSHTGYVEPARGPFPFVAAA